MNKLLLTHGMTRKGDDKMSFAHQHHFKIKYKACKFATKNHVIQVTLTSLSFQPVCNWSSRVDLSKSIICNVCFGSPVEKKTPCNKNEFLLGRDAPN